MSFFSPVRNEKKTKVMKVVDLYWEIYPTCGVVLHLDVFSKFIYSSNISEHVMANFGNY